MQCCKKTMLLGTLVVIYSFVVSVIESHGVEIVVEKMTCNTSSEPRPIAIAWPPPDEDPDELYFIVSGLDPKGQPIKTDLIPGDNRFYLGKPGAELAGERWLDHEGERAKPPVLWKGTIPNGKTAVVYVVMLDRDEGPLKKVQDELPAFQERIAKIMKDRRAPHGITSSMYDEVKNLIKPTGDDIVGQFLIEVTGLGLQLGASRTHPGLAVKGTGFKWRAGNFTAFEGHATKNLKGNKTVYTQRITMKGETDRRPIGLVQRYPSKYNLRVSITAGLEL